MVTLVSHNGSALGLLLEEDQVHHLRLVPRHGRLILQDVQHLCLLGGISQRRLHLGKRLHRRCLIHIHHVLKLLDLDVHEIKYLLVVVIDVHDVEHLVLPMGLARVLLLDALPVGIEVLLQRAGGGSVVLPEIAEHLWVARNKVAELAQDPHGLGAEHRDGSNPRDDHQDPRRGMPEVVAVVRAHPVEGALERALLDEAGDSQVLLTRDVAAARQAELVTVLLVVTLSVGAVQPAFLALKGSRVCAIGTDVLRKISKSHDRLALVCCACFVYSLLSLAKVVRIF